MAGGRDERGSRRRTRAASVVVPFPRSAAGSRLDLARLVPSGRSLLATVLGVSLVLAAYWIARASSAFAVERVDVRGDAPPAVLKQVRAATSDLVGKSLLTVDPGRIESRVRALPTIAGVSIDRAFPHTLVVRVAAERPVAVARAGRKAWLVTGSGRAIGGIATGTQLRMPRIWLPRGETPAAGHSLPVAFVPAARAVGAANRIGLGRRVKAVRLRGDELIVVLRRGIDVRLGAPTDVALKLAVAGRVLRAIDADPAYVDVSVPERPVAARDAHPQPLS